HPCVFDCGGRRWGGGAVGWLGGGGDRVAPLAGAPILRDVIARAGTPAITYGFTDRCDVVVRVDGLGPDGARGTLRTDDGEVSLALRIDGAHNLLNAAAAIVVARLAGVSVDVATTTLETFAGVHRRFEHRGDAAGGGVFDDYRPTPAGGGGDLSDPRGRRAPGLGPARPASRTR